MFSRRLLIAVCASFTCHLERGRHYPHLPDEECETQKGLKKKKKVAQYDLGAVGGGALGHRGV